MNATRLKAALVLVLALAAVVGATAWRPTARLADTRPPVELETLFPKQFGDWRIDDRMPVQLVSPDTAAALSKIYSATLSRTYVNVATEQRVMLSVAYGGDQSDATRAHRPEVCYPAQGFEIGGAHFSTVTLQGGVVPVRQLVAHQGTRNEPITYWIMVGEKVTTTGTQQKLAQLSYSTRGVVPDGMLVRVSTIDHDQMAAYALQSGFVKQMAAAIPRTQKPLVIGRANTAGAI